MAHYSEMDFLFSNQTNRDSITKQISNTSNANKNNIFNSKKVVVYKQKKGDYGTEKINSYLKDKIYKNEASNLNPYVNLIKDFNVKDTPALVIKASDLAYLKELGVYPMNRMAILRRFPEGCFVNENLLEDMKMSPISTIIGWIKPDKNFGEITFNEKWSTVNKRFDQVLAEAIQKSTGGFVDISKAIPIPDFAQGVLFEFYKKLNLTQRSGIDDSVDEPYEYYNVGLSAEQKNNAGGVTDDNNVWGLNNIPVGDPNVLQEGPFRDPEGQNIESQFTFELETTYEQKLIGDVDPGSAMLDILDNIYAMGTSNMVFYWGDNSPRIKNLKDATSGKGNDLIAWWEFVKNLTIDFYNLLLDMFKGAIKTIGNTVEDLRTKAAAGELKDIINEEQILEDVTKVMKTILTSTIAIHRFKLRGSIELMVGGALSSTPWYLTIGNPYSPWLSTNHIVIKTASIETSTEMGFNDQPQWLKAKFSCQFSRSLGKQELMRMFNNTYRRTYSNVEGSKDNPLSLGEVSVIGTKT